MENGEWRMENASGAIPQGECPVDIQVNEPQADGMLRIRPNDELIISSLLRLKWHIIVEWSTSGSQHLRNSPFSILNSQFSI